MKKTKIFFEDFEIDGCKLQGENPLPLFRDPNHDFAVDVTSDFPQKYTELLGSACGFRVLPYRVQDRYSRERKKITLKTIVLENNFLKARFLCEYGGRLYS
ncbi:MAG: hypothetical protein ACRC5H_08610, partial [Treponemataceae bacterium]